MPWPSGGPRTWNPGETVTADQMNEQLRDALNILKTFVSDEGRLITCLLLDSTARVSSGTGETDASTYQLPAGTLAVNGMSLRIRAFGKGGASGTFTWRFYWNGASIHSGVVTAATGTWQAEGWIMRSGASAQVAVMWSSVLAGGLNTATPVAHPALNTTVWDSGAPVNADLTTAIDLKTTLQASANTVTQIGLAIALQSAS